jgi:hypothetical protein
MFWKKKDQPALPKPGFNAAAGLRGNFAMARFGNACRTLSLRHPEGGNLASYRQIAWLGPNAGWRVMEISEQLPETKLPPQSRIKADNLDFISAIENIAEWQAGQIKLGFAADEAEAEKLGMSYYVPFGERECLAFDIHNQPHVTANGVIITEGYFTDEMRDKIRENFGKPVLVAASENQPLLTGLFTSGPVPQTADLDNIMKRMVSHAAMDDLRYAFAEMNNILVYLFEYNVADTFYSEKNILTLDGDDFGRSHRHPMNSGKPSQVAATYIRKVLNYSEKPLAYMDRRIQECQTVISTLRSSGAIDKQEQKALERICASYSIIFKTMAAHYLAGYATQHPSEKEKYMKESAEFIGAAEAEMRQNQVTDTWQVKAYALREGTPALPQFFKDFVDQFTKAVELYDKQTQSDKQRSLAVQPYQSLPKPESR